MIVHLHYATGPLIDRWVETEKSGVRKYEKSVQRRLEMKARREGGETEADEGE